MEYRTEFERQASRIVADVYADVAQDRQTSWNDGNWDEDYRDKALISVSSVVDDAMVELISNEEYYQIGSRLYELRHIRLIGKKRLREIAESKIRELKDRQGWDFPHIED